MDSPETILQMYSNATKLSETVHKFITSANYQLAFDDSDHEGYHYCEKTIRDQTDAEDLSDLRWLNMCLTESTRAVWVQNSDGEFEATLLIDEIYDQFENHGTTLRFRDSYGMSCTDCGEQMYLNLTIRSDTLCISITSDKQCAHHKDYYVDIDFPTGELIVDDWPPFFSELEEKGFLKSSRGFGLDTTAGIRKSSENAAAQGYGHFFVGNTCPVIWRTERGINVGYTPREDNLGSVCTDLWWTTIMDVSLYSQLLEKIGQEYSPQLFKDNWTLNLVKVEPGRYRIKPYYGLYTNGPDSNSSCYDENDNEIELVFATIERIGDCKADD